MKYTIFAVLIILTFVITAKNDKSNNKSICSLTNQNLVTIGDSLANGYGIDANDSFAIQTAKLLNKKPIKLGKNGETTSQLLQRIDNTLNKIQSIAAIIISIGGNDFLRNVDKRTTEANLDKIINIAKKHTSCIILLGTPGDIKDNILGNVSTIYAKIASKHNILLEKKSMNQILKSNNLKIDQIHPNIEGHNIIAKNIAQLVNQYK